MLKYYFHATYYAGSISEGNLSVDGRHHRLTLMLLILLEVLVKVTNWLMRVFAWC